MDETPPNPNSFPPFDYSKLFPSHPRLSKDSQEDQANRRKTVSKIGTLPKQLFCRLNDTLAPKDREAGQFEDPTPLPPTPDPQTTDAEEEVTEQEGEFEYDDEVMEAADLSVDGRHELPQETLESDSDMGTVNESHPNLGQQLDPNTKAPYCADSDNSTWMEARRRKIDKRRRENSKYLPLSLRRRHSGGALLPTQPVLASWRTDHKGKVVRQRQDGTESLGAIFLKEDESLDRDKLINVDRLFAEKRQDLADELHETSNTWINIRKFNEARADKVGNAELADLKPALDPATNAYCNTCGEYKRREAVDRRNPVIVTRLPLQTQDRKRHISPALIDLIDKMRAEAGLNPFPNRAVPAMSEAFVVNEKGWREKKVFKLCRAAMAMDVEDIPDVIVNSPDAVVEDDFHPGVMEVKEIMTPGFGYPNHDRIKTMQLVLSDLRQTQAAVYHSPDSVFNYCNVVEDLLSTRISPRSDGKYQAVSFDYPRGTLTGILKGSHKITNCGLREDQLVSHVYGLLPTQATPSRTFMQYAADAVMIECDICEELRPREWEEARERLLTGIIDLYQNMEKTADIE